MAEIDNAAGRSAAEAVRRAQEYRQQSRTWARGESRRRGRPAAVATSRAASRTASREWVDPYSAYDDCGVSDVEYEAARAAALEDLLKGKKPVKEDATPHLLITVGAPGAGKSTVSEAVAAARSAAGSGDYVTIDFDVAVKYHPRHRGIWAATSAVTGKPTGVGYTLSYLACNDTLQGLLVGIFQDIIYGEGPKYNIVLQSHSQVDIILTKAAGYRVTLLYVGVPLAVARARSRRRAVATGKFLAPNLAAQDEVVEVMWGDYRLTAVWYGMWADEFLVADNRRPAKSDAAARKAVLKNVKEVRLHCEDWEACRRKAQAAVDAACAP